MAREHMTLGVRVTIERPANAESRPTSIARWIAVGCAALLACDEAKLPAKADPPVFVETLDSDAWVAQTFHIQRHPERVIVVSHDGRAPPSIEAPRLDLSARPSARSRAMETRRADWVVSTLQAASNLARGGDLIAVMPGRYEGFSIDERPGAGDGRYVHIQALGAPGEVIVDKPARADGARWMVYVRAAHHIILDGLWIMGDRSPKGPAGGVMLDGDFGRSGLMTHHIVVTGVTSVGHGHWGLHSTDTHTVLVQDGVYGLSALEHGAYVSDGSDNYVIRRNVFFGNRACGLQINLDPEASLDEVQKHPALRGYPKAPSPPSRAWAEGLLARATALFGERNFPDGVGERFIIEENVMNDNGSAGGAALNLAGLRRSLIQNNLLYGNRAHGIAMWNNANPFDAPLIDPGPRSMEEAVSAANVPLFGCSENLVRNNTVLAKAHGRAAFQAIHGSYGARLYNNVLINDEGPSLQLSNTSIMGFEAGPNVLASIDLGPFSGALEPLASTPPERDAIRVTSAFDLAGEVIAFGSAPWMIVEGGRPRENPARPDFHPRAGSKLLAGRGEPRALPARDREGAPRLRADIGAFVAR